MKIHLTIFTPNKKQIGYSPEKFIYNGNYALETMIIKITEKYFGLTIARKIEDLLNNRLNGEEKI